MVELSMKVKVEVTDYLAWTNDPDLEDSVKDGAEIPNDAQVVNIKEDSDRTADGKAIYYHIYYITRQ